MEKLSQAFYSKSGVRLGARALAKEAGVSEAKAKAFLAKQEIAQIYKKPVRQKVQPRFNVPTAGSMQQADLLILPDDNGYKQALVVVDGHSRKVDAEPLKDKTPGAALTALKKIYARHPAGEPLSAPPLRMMTDAGAEFKGAFDKYLADNKVQHAVGEPGHHQSQAMVEAANKEIGSGLLRRMQAQELLTGEQSREWKEELPDMVASINRGRKPRKPAPERLLGEKVEEPKRVKDLPVLLTEGTSVRTALDHPVNPINNQKLYGRFRASDPKWSTYTSTVEEVILTPGQPPLYRISGHKGRFPRDRLMPVGQNEPPRATVISGKPSTYIVQEILEKRKVGSKVEYKVRWRGYPMEEATWEPRAKLVADVPAMVKKFDKQQGSGRLTVPQIVKLLRGA